VNAGSNVHAHDNFREFRRLVGLYERFPFEDITGWRNWRLLVLGIEGGSPHAVAPLI
jgi:hypothetical protein